MCLSCSSGVFTHRLMCVLATVLPLCVCVSKSVSVSLGVLCLFIKEGLCDTIETVR